MDDLFASLAPLGVIAVIGWIVRIFVVNNRIKKIAALQVEMQTKLLEKFDDAEQLRSFLESESGSKLLEATPIEKSSPFGRILASIQAGVILLMGGLALLGIRSQMPIDSPEGFGLLFLGGLAAAVGVGFLLSAGAAFGLSKSWGLINGNSN